MCDLWSVECKDHQYGPRPDGEPILPQHRDPLQVSAVFVLLPGGRQWGSRPRRHIKAEQQSDPAAALCFCFAVSTQHGGREKRWWSAPVRPPGRRFHASSSVLVPDKLKGGPKRILWM